jgi:ribosomal subunit interface protein
MNVIVQSKTLVVTEAIRSFVRRQVLRLNRRGQKIGQITVFLENVSKKKNDIQSASAKILIDLPGKNIVVQQKAKDLYMAISEAARSATQQVNRAKQKRLRHSGRFAFASVEALRSRR